jgi:choline-glycine betaine transporter
MFIAKISRGRTLRQFVSVVVLVPSAVSFIWFAIFGTTAIDQQMKGAGLEVSPPENVLFGVLDNLPFAGVTTVLLGVLVAIFFVTGADSASLVMGTLSQQGRPDPSRWITVVWGTLVGAIAAVLLATGNGSGDGLTALQNATIVAALQFGIIMAAMMVAFLKDLRRDPLILRDAYAERAVRHSVRTGLEEYGDDFALVPTEYDHSKDDLQWVEPNVDEEFAKVYTDSETGMMPIINPDGTKKEAPKGASDESIPDRSTWAPPGIGGDSPGAGPGSNPVREGPDAPRR